MTDDRNKSSGSSHSLPRPTARDVPFTRGADSESEPAPRGQRPAQLPRDPTYEAELAQVELAVLRDPAPKEDPSPKPGRRALPSLKQPVPESVTPESPAVGLARSPTLPSPEAPPVSPHGRSVASGTLLSVGAVDPRGKTERTLETPRMFISQQQSSEAYFKPGKIPAVTVHQTIETETVKLSDSIDPRRAKTMPRIDRAALQHLGDVEGGEELPDYSLPRSSLDVANGPSPHWNQAEWDAHDEDEELASENGEQIHASLSPFREQAAASSFSLEGVSTRPEPLAARRSDLPPPVSAPAAPDTSTVPTHRDLPVHRVVTSHPPPPGKVLPVTVPHAPVVPALGSHPRANVSTTAVTQELPLNRPVWVNYAAFFAALVFAVVIGLWLTRGSEPQRGVPVSAAPAREVPPRAVEPARPVVAPAARPSAPAATAVPPPLEASEPVAPARPVAAQAPIEKAAPSAPPVRARSTVAPHSEPVAPPVPAASRKSNTSKTNRETIF
jgi:hypothetical protein